LLTINKEEMNEFSLENKKRKKKSREETEITSDDSYEELLKSIFDVMREKNLVPAESKVLTIALPRIGRSGKKTIFDNFLEISKQIKRTPKHLLLFLLTELGTSGSIDVNNRLIIRGRFQPKHIESILRKYVKEYVTCHICHSTETELQKDLRLVFLTCSKCRSRCSVANVKPGFQALTSKRIKNG
jgi:Translation initiation factor 2, beta subunit (eIF-2beta)/eIF-5 N-terminal domain